VSRSIALSGGFGDDFSPLALTPEDEVRRELLRRGRTCAKIVEISRIPELKEGQAA
jgi:hypothetical protein